MVAYVFQSSFYCQECAESLMENQLTLPNGAEPGDETTWDSDEYPKGPYPNGGGEADTPQHCENCDCFLENPLTTDGYAYVEEAVKNDEETASAIVEEWAKFYGFTYAKDSLLD